MRVAWRLVGRRLLCSISREALLETLSAAVHGCSTYSKPSGCALRVGSHQHRHLNTSGCNRESLCCRIVAIESLLDHRK